MNAHVQALVAYPYQVPSVSISTMHDQHHRSDHTAAVGAAPAGAAPSAAAILDLLLAPLLPPQKRW
jgi:hypothetical protein